MGLMTPAFVVAPSTLEKQQLDMPQPERFAALAAAAAMLPEAAHAANNGYALQQLFSAIFVIGLVTAAFRSQLAALRRKGKRAAAQAAVAAAAVMACMAMVRPQKRCFFGKHRCNR